MSLSRFFNVITTIQPPTLAVTALAERLRSLEAPLIIIGDKKGPSNFDLPGSQFFSLARQLESPFELAKRLPVGHYTRKNVGYLEAIGQGAECIYETDDDNAPLVHWQPRDEYAVVQEVAATGWVNVYRCFSDERIWPRGLAARSVRSRVRTISIYLAPFPPASPRWSRILSWRLHSAMSPRLMPMGANCPVPLSRHIRWKGCSVSKPGFRSPRLSSAWRRRNRLVVGGAKYRMRPIPTCG